MAEIYTTLLSLDVGVFGIVISAILVHLTMVTSQYSYRAPHLLVRRNYLFWSAACLSGTTALLAGIGSLRLALAGADLVPRLNLHSGELVRSPAFLVITVVLSGLEYVLVFLLIYRYLGYFPVRDVVAKIAKQITWNKVKLFLLIENAVSDPHPPNRGASIRENPPKPAELAEILKRLRKQMSKEPPDDPFALLIDATSAAIMRHDMEGWRVARAVIWQKYAKLFIEFVQDRDSDLLGRYLVELLAKNVIKRLRFLIELVEQEGHPSFALDVISLAGDIGSEAVEPETLDEVATTIIDDFLELEAERAISPGNESRLEISLKALTKIAGRGIEASTDRAAHHAFRTIAKVAEAYIQSGRTIPRSQISSRQLQDERPADCLMDAFYETGHKLIDRDREGISPEYWVYLSVTARVIEEFISASSDDHDYTRIVQLLLDNIQSIATRAAEIADAAVLERACMYLGNLYRHSRENGDRAEICKTITHYFVDCGEEASIHNVRVDDGKFDLRPPKNNPTLTGIILAHMQRVLSAEHMRQAIYEADHRLATSDELLDEFILPAMKMTDDNFGFPYDPATGRRLVE